MKIDQLNVNSEIDIIIIVIFDNLYDKYQYNIYYIDIYNYYTFLLYINII